METKIRVTSRAINRLTVKSIPSLASGQHHDGGGLFLRKSETGSSRWVLRVSVNGKPKQIGLGSYPDVGLADARKERDKWKAVAKTGQNPVLVRKLERFGEHKEIETRLTTVEEVAIDAYETRKPELKGEANARRWYGALKNHILPALGRYPIENINQIHLRETLKPIWRTKPEAARKAINRFNIIMLHGAALGLDVDLNAIAKAKALLGKQMHVEKHHPSMPWREVPHYYSGLPENTPTQVALKLLILNPGPRSKPIRFFRSEHLDGTIWTIPAELMKGIKGKTKDWRTTLSPESMRLVQVAKRFEHQGNLFPSVTGKTVISDASMSKQMTKDGIPYRPHGFRHAFKTWTAETRQSFMISELCLAHTFTVNSQANYLLTDYLEERREMMDRWSSYVTGDRGFDGE